MTYNTNKKWSFINSSSKFFIFFLFMLETVCLRVLFLILYISRRVFNFDPWLNACGVLSDWLNLRFLETAQFFLILLLTPCATWLASPNSKIQSKSNPFQLKILLMFDQRWLRESYTYTAFQQFHQILYHLDWMSRCKLYMESRTWVGFYVSRKAVTILDSKHIKQNRNHKNVSNFETQ